MNGAERHAGRSGSGKDTSYRKCRLIPPHQSLSRQLPPQGEAFLTLCEQSKYDFELWVAFTIRPHPSPSASNCLQFGAEGDG